MKIGTWNLDGKAAAAHTNFVLAQNCDVLLLTEVNEKLVLDGYQLTLGKEEMLHGKRWAAVASKQEHIALESPHSASTAAVIEGTTFVSSILPWNGSAGNQPWEGDNHPDRMKATLNALSPFLHSHQNLVWGGDWNQSLTGPEHAGSDIGRTALLGLLAELELVVPTTTLPHRIDTLRSIDHVAVRHGVEQAERVSAIHNMKRLSDHDLYSIVTTDTI